jgi:hypothetical protein
MADSVQDPLLNLFQFARHFEDVAIEASFLRKLRRFLAMSNAQAIRAWPALKKFALKNRYPDVRLWKVKYFLTQPFRGWRKEIAKMNGDLTKIVVRCNAGGRVLVQEQFRLKLALLDTGIAAEPEGLLGM